MRGFGKKLLQNATGFRPDLHSWRFRARHALIRGTPGRDRLRRRSRSRRTHPGLLCYSFLAWAIAVRLTDARGRRLCFRTGCCVFFLKAIGGATRVCALRRLGSLCSPGSCYRLLRCSRKAIISIIVRLVVTSVSASSPSRTMAPFKTAISVRRPRSRSRNMEGKCPAVLGTISP